MSLDFATRASMKRGYSVANGLVGLSCAAFVGWFVAIFANSIAYDSLYLDHRTYVAWLVAAH